MADAVAKEAVVKVALVFAPALAERAEVSLDVGARHAQQRADNAKTVTYHNGVNTRQPARACAAQEFQQHRFPLVVERVGGGNAVEALLRGDFGEPPVARPPGYGFDAQLAGAGLVANVAAMHKKFQPVVLR